MNQLPGSFRRTRAYPRTHTLTRTQVLRRTWPFVLDMIVAGMGLACFYGVLKIASLWLGHMQPSVEISLSPRALPRYALLSIARIAIAYVLSLIFAIVYGYVAAYSRRLETLMLAALDILQSIPVLSFLPSVMLAMVSLFPTHQIGLELGSILLIFTGQAWNIAYSFYSSIKGLPRELQEVSTVYGFNRWQKLWQLELPFAATGLIWNSMVSVAGGWFFLMACEMFVLGARDFRLPGLGSYLQTAASAGDITAILWGLLTMIAIIVITDQLFWRPVIAWGDRFRFETDSAAPAPRSPLLHALQQSRAIRALRTRTIAPLQEHIYARLAKRRSSHQEYDKSRRRGPSYILRGAVYAFVLAAVLFFAVRALDLLQLVTLGDFFRVLRGAGATFLRVNAALLLAALWTIPVGVAIGTQPRLARIAQPIVQIAASVPATALFPILLLVLIRLRGGLELSAILLMLLGTQWYILFNVIAGAMALPTDLTRVGEVFRFTRMQRWQTIILPGIFPYLVTGMVTASGGAWNASIIAEYFRLKNETHVTFGLGSQISAATDRGQFHILLLATIVMALMVVTINRLLWRPLFRLAETKYRLGN
ncbi:MAG: ABC transporter permease subunit [Acidobacteria bacterium]|nr:ABC transporter permease subunit [Acidobacteriota bacterium]